MKKLLNAFVFVCRTVGLISLIFLTTSCSTHQDISGDDLDLLYIKDPKHILASSKSGQVNESGVWINLYDGLEQTPTDVSTLVIRPGHRIHVSGHPGILSFENILIMKGGELIIEDDIYHEITINGRMVVDGSVTGHGNNKIIFGSDDERSAGFWAREDSVVKLYGRHILEKDFISSVKNNHSSNLSIQLRDSKFSKDELVGRTLKFRSGLRNNVQYEIVGNDESNVIINLNSKGNTYFGALQESIIAESVAENNIFIRNLAISNNPIPRKAFLKGKSGDNSATYVGDWVKFQDSGNMYLIVQLVRSSITGGLDNLVLANNVKAEDFKKKFDVVHGISTDDEISILEPFKFSIPDSDKLDGQRNSIFYAHGAEVVLDAVEFSYFGAAGRQDNSIKPWPKEARGAAITLQNLRNPIEGSNRVISDVEVSATFAGASIQVLESSGLHITRNYIWNVHGQINPNSAGEMGHGWVFQNVKDLNFDNNVIINQGDDHLFMTGLLKSISIINNKMYSAPTPRGNSTNNAELTLVDGSDDITISGNILLNSDGPLNIVCFSNCQNVHVLSNIVSSALDPNAAILTLVNIKGSVNNNLIMNGSIGLAVFGKSSVTATNNIFRDLTLAARNVSNFHNNIIQGASLVFDSSFGEFLEDIYINSNILAGADGEYGVSLIINDFRNDKKYKHFIYRNTFDAKISQIYRGTPITLNLGNNSAVVDRNIILNGSIGIRGAQNLSNNYYSNYFGNILNEYTGNVEYITSPSDINFSIVYNGKPLFDSSSGFGYRLKKLDFDSPITPPDMDFGYEKAGLSGNTSFPIPVIHLKEYLLTSNLFARGGFKYEVQQR
jgi:hypothetical protein